MFLPCVTENVWSLEVYHWVFDSGCYTTLCWVSAGTILQLLLLNSVGHFSNEFVCPCRAFAPLKKPPSNMTHWDKKLNYMKDELKANSKYISYTKPFTGTINV